jgi:hypothetical protein
MKRNISETPDRWVILKLPEDNYKVFGTWAGGYLDGDRWKANSGIVSVEEDEENYYFKGYSGSCYKCHKKSYGTMTSFGTTILDSIIDKAEGKIQVMLDSDDWTALV